MGLPQAPRLGNANHAMFLGRALEGSGMGGKQTRVWNQETQGGSL